MNPYYADESVTLYHGDCREVTAWLEADVLVTDPPYGIHMPSRWHLNDVAFAGEVKTGRAATRTIGPEHVEVRDEALRLWGSRPGLVFGSWRAPRPAETRARLIWDKGLMGVGNIALPWGVSEEDIYVTGEWPKRIPGGRAREGGNPSRFPNIVRVKAYAPGAATRPDHPTPKPPELLRALIQNCPQGTVADPFAGSGPTLIAARSLGRRSIGVEVDERYCELIATRLAQGDLFGGVA